MGTLRSAMDELSAQLRDRPRRWLVTGAAGFIGSHLTERLLQLGQHVVALDNFATGSRANVDDVLRRAGAAAAARLSFIEGDIRDPAVCARACEGVDLVLHQAALGSVPRSIKDPLQTHEVNVTGFVRMMCAARDAGVRRFVYASSSSVYGDHPALPKVEDVIGNPLSPYAVSKRADELYAHAFALAYGVEPIGLRYFNVFGPRQDPEGPYAAVIPRWFAGMAGKGELVIHGDGETSRDFCFVENVVQANLLAATVADKAAVDQVYNVAFGARTTLNELFALIRERVAAKTPAARSATAAYRDFRAGDVRHSLADIGKARRLLGYEPAFSVGDGLDRAAEWYTAAGR